MRRGLAVLFALALTATAAAAPPSKPHVTLITDSVGGSLGWDARAAAIFARGLDADLELASCRRLTTPSCAVTGMRAPENALETIRRLGSRVGPNLAIDVGYNDYPTVYAPGIDEILAAARRAGVQQVFWVTLRASNPAYAETNAAIRGAARRHPELTVIDWNACSAGHPDWFAADGVHLTSSGAEGLGACLNAGILGGLRAPPPLDVELDPRSGISPRFVATLHATGGTPPYRFAVRGLPRGLHERGAGVVVGTLPDRGHFVLRVTVRDAVGRRALARVALDVSTGRAAVVARVRGPVSVSGTRSRG